MVVYIDTITFLETERKTLKVQYIGKANVYQIFSKNLHWPRNTNLQRCVKRLGNQHSPCRFTVQHLHWTFLCPPQLKRRNSRPSGLHKTNLIPTLQLKHQVFEYNPPNFLFNAQEFIIWMNCCKYVSKMDFYKS